MGLVIGIGIGFGLILGAYPDGSSNPGPNTSGLIRPTALKAYHLNPTKSRTRRLQKRLKKPESLYLQVIEYQAVEAWVRQPSLGRDNLPVDHRFIFGPSASSSFRLKPTMLITGNV